MPDPTDWPDAAPSLGLPYLAPSQAQKHVTVNEALRLLDALVQLTVLDRNRGLPPDDPAPGQRHIVGAAAAGGWAGQAGRIALWDGPGGWLFLAPGRGWRAWVVAEGAIAVWDGSAWAGPEALALRAERLGVGTAADAANRLAVAGAATLLTHSGSGHQVKINKAAAADTASLLFQTGFSGRAEMGTAGSDAFALKVSADGAAWTTALTADAATGRVFLPVGLRAAFGSAGTPALAFEGDADTGVFRAGSDILAFAAGGAERARVTAGGLQVTGTLSGTAVTQSATDTTAGRLTRTGDFGIGLVSGVPEVADLDDQATPSGLYRTTNATTPGTWPPTFANVACYLSVRRWSTTNCEQQLTRQGVTTHGLWRRICINGTWQAWQLVGAPVLGAVAQTGGVPTGALIERGSNANGEFVRFADGTQICAAGFGSSGAGADDIWTFPAAFAAGTTPRPAITPAAASGTARLGTAVSVTATALTYAIFGVDGLRKSAAHHVTAIGRWF